MEGSSRERNVVVEFADMATAGPATPAPNTRRPRAIRQQHADADFLIVEGA
jgi:uncharacterized protein (DUF1330 family)